jgi:gamma-glutamyl-gamma-aminobutyrate hydrolase PuuD
MTPSPFRQLGLKLLSALLGVMLWLVVAGEEMVVRGLRIPLALQQFPAGLELESEPPSTVEVRVRGSSGTLGRLSSADVVAVIDLRGVHAGRRLFPLMPEQVRAPFGVEIVQVDAEEIEKPDGEKMLHGLGGICVPGGFGERGIEGKIKAAKFARENKVPYLGLCLGMQIATIEFARNVLKLDKAHSTEFDADSPHPVIALLDAQKKVTKKGGTMRLGAQPAQLTLGTKTAQLYGSFVVNERHRHRYEFNNTYRERFEKAGFIFSGVSSDGKLVEIIELADHPFFIASQFHPEFHSKPHQPHPLFKGFIAAAHARLREQDDGDEHDETGAVHVAPPIPRKARYTPNFAEREDRNFRKAPAAPAESRYASAIASRAMAWGSGAGCFYFRSWQRGSERPAPAPRKRAAASPAYCAPAPANSASCVMASAAAISPAPARRSRRAAPQSSTPSAAATARPTRADARRTATPSRSTTSARAPRAPRSRGSASPARTT